jgi:hypothetical protein
MSAVSSSNDHIWLSENKISDVGKKRLRAHIVKILKKIPHGDRPAVALDEHSRMLSAIPG